MRIVYDGGRANHADSDVISYEVNDWKNSGIIIGDAVAQAIAAQWHSPGNETAALSTRGIVTADMTSVDFCDHEEFDALDHWGQMEILALHQYIVTKQIEAGLNICQDCDTMQVLNDNNVCKECAA